MQDLVLKEALLLESPCVGFGGRGGRGEDTERSFKARDSIAGGGGESVVGGEEELEEVGGDGGGGGGGFLSDV